MLNEELDYLKELIYELEEEVCNGNTEEAAATLDFIISTCGSLKEKI